MSDCKNLELNFSTIFIDVQYIVFVVWLTGQAKYESAYRLFIVFLIMNCACLLFAPVLGWLALKNKNKKNKVMNICLILLFMSGIPFIILLNNFMKGNESMRYPLVGVSLGILVLSIIYTVLNHSMKKLYRDMVAVLYLENAYRISKHADKWVQLLFNFVGLMLT